MGRALLVKHTATRFLFQGFFAHFYLRKKFKQQKCFPRRGIHHQAKQYSASWLVRSFKSASCRLFPKYGTSTPLVWLPPDSKAETSRLPGWSPPDS
ncbi:unnamed protein product [Staurois parvus]|uniref:Uncharacterized protein n=1 Tax=Staurois parvus TaxID=386267 RepID=A0ABN9ABF1_9NEOB|nr:unnamed protein product [Staurois parvus]